VCVCVCFCSLVLELELELVLVLVLVRVLVRVCMRWCVCARAITSHTTHRYTRHTIRDTHTSPIANHTHTTTPHTHHTHLVTPPTNTIHITHVRISTNNLRAQHTYMLPKMAGEKVEICKFICTYAYIGICIYMYICVYTR